MAHANDGIYWPDLSGYCHSRFKWLKPQPALDPNDLGTHDLLSSARELYGINPQAGWHRC